MMRESYSKGTGPSLPRPDKRQHADPGARHDPLARIRTESNPALCVVAYHVARSGFAVTQITGKCRRQRE